MPNSPRLRVVRPADAAALNVATNAKKPPASPKASRRRLTKARASAPSNDDRQLVPGGARKQRTGPVGCPLRSGYRQTQNRASRDRMTRGPGMTSPVGMIR